MVKFLCIYYIFLYLSHSFWSFVRSFTLRNESCKYSQKLDFSKKTAHLVLIVFQNREKLRFVELNFCASFSCYSSIYCTKKWCKTGTEHMNRKWQHVCSTCFIHVRRVICINIHIHTQCEQKEFPKNIVQFNELITMNVCEFHLIAHSSLSYGKFAHKIKLLNGKLNGYW